MPASFLWPAYRLRLTSFCLGLVTRGRKLALSTFDDARGAHRLFLIRGDGCDVRLLHRTERGIGIVRVGFIPIEAGKILLQPRFLEHLAATRVNLLAHLTGVLDKQTIEQRARNRLAA